MIMFNLYKRKEIIGNPSLNLSPTNRGERRKLQGGTKDYDEK